MSSVLGPSCQLGIAELRARRRANRFSDTVPRAHPFVTGTEPAPGEPPAAAPKPMPPLLEQAWNLARAAKDFVADKFTRTSEEEHAERMAICEPCEMRRENRCAACGCYLATKAWGRAFTCPSGKWPVLTPADEAVQAES